MRKDTFTSFVAFRILLDAEHLGNVKVKKLLTQFESPEYILSKSPKELSIEGKLTPAVYESLVNIKNNIDKLKAAAVQEWESMLKMNAKIVTYTSPEYPKTLQNIYDPPLVLYCLGDISLLSVPAIGIVGTRSPSNYGKKVTAILAKGAAENKLAVISGLALGIDTAAHKNTLQANGKTIAVLGSGIDKIYPPENKKLAAEICEKGLILTEFGPNTKPDSGNFPRRNRIISGLSMGVVIVESGVKGGSMYTARFANDQNREVFAVPGNIDSLKSEGPNYLIQRGEAKLVKDINDICEELNLNFKKQIQSKEMPSDLNIFESTITEKLSNEPVQLDNLAELTGFSTSECLVHLLSLEFRGIVRQLPGKYFILN